MRYTHAGGVSQSTDEESVWFSNDVFQGETCGHLDEDDDALGGEGFGDVLPRLSAASFAHLALMAALCKHLPVSGDLRCPCVLHGRLTG